MSADRDPSGSRLFRWTAIATTVLLLLALALVAVAGFRRPGGLRTGANEFVNERSAQAAFNSPTVAVHPTRPGTMAVGIRRDAPGFACFVSVTTNGGATWRPLNLTPGLAATNCFWPRVAYDEDGTLLVLYTPLGGPNLLPLGVFLQRFDPDLAAVGAPVQVAGDLAFWARLAVQGRRAWVSWVQAGPATAENQLGLAPGDNPVVVARSDDGGRSFKPPVRLGQPGFRVIQPTLLVNGENVLVGALDLLDDVQNYEASHDGQTPTDPSLHWRVVVWASTDFGAIFGPTQVAGDSLPVPQLILADLGPTPGIARDPIRDRIYVTWDAGRGDTRDVFVTASENGGSTWTAPVPVGPRARSQLLPAIGVAPDGRLDVVFHDRSRDPQDILTEVVVASSWDGGRTFRWTTVSDTAFDSRIGLGAQQGVPSQGEHLAVASLPEGPVGFWSDTSRGSLAENVQDLALARVVAKEPGGLRWAVAVPAAALVLASLAMAVIALRARPGRGGTGG